MSYSAIVSWYLCKSLVCERNLSMAFLQLSSNAGWSLNWQSPLIEQVHIQSWEMLTTIECRHLPAVEAPLGSAFCKLQWMLLDTEMMPRSIKMITWHRGCKGTLLSADLPDGISLPHDSGYILSMQCLVCPATSLVNHLLPNWLHSFFCPNVSVSFWDNSAMETLETHSKVSLCLFHYLPLLYLSLLSYYHHSSSSHCS